MLNFLRCLSYIRYEIEGLISFLLIDTAQPPLSLMLGQQKRQGGYVYGCS